MTPKKRPTTAGNADLEWIGGRFQLPAYVMEPKPFRPEMILWLEMPSGLVVGSNLIDPNGSPVSLIDTFYESAREPLAGKARRPRRVRVASRDLAAELSSLAEEGIVVHVAPTPEIDAFVEAMMRRPAFAEDDDSASYLADGRVSEQAVAGMFVAARYLWAVAPWKVMYDSQTLRCDISAYDVRGACISIIGNLGESFGVLLFPSERAYEAFGDSRGESRRKGRVDLGTSVLSLEFDPAESIPAGMRREIEEHGWSVPGPWALPRVFHRDRDGTPRPLTQRDVEIATACAMSVATFYMRNEPLLDPDVEELEPVSMTIENETGIAVRFTYPYGAYDLFEPVPTRRMPSPMASKTGRNDPCPCGSGKKYKKCHLEADERIRRDVSRREEIQGQRASIHAEDEHLVERMIHWARPRFDRVQGRVADDFRQPATATSLLLPWSVYGFEIDGHPIVWHFLQDAAVDLTGAERRWLEAQLAAWLSVWEVQEVQPGRGMVLLDLLTGEKRQVLETSASQTLVVRDAILARVVDGDEVVVLCGVHPRPLPPRQAAGVVKLVRAHLRSKGTIGVQRLRSCAVGRQLIQNWENAVERLDRDRRTPMQLRNTDSEKIVFTVDRWTFEAAKRDDVANRLAALDGVQEPDEGADDIVYTVVKPGNQLHENWENTIVAKLTLERDALAVETNSVRRANDMRRRVESACGALLRDRKRRQQSQAKMFADVQRVADTAEAKSPPLPPPEIAAVLREHKQRYYEKWLDGPIPALDGKTPRQAASVASHRSKLDLLLKEMENQEARVPEVERADFRRIRIQLGM